MTETSRHVTFLMESSIDGRVDETRWSAMFSTKGEGDPDVYYETYGRIHRDCALAGRVTVAMHQEHETFKPAKPFAPPADLSVFRGIRKTARMIAVFDSRGTIAYSGKPIWGDSVVAVLGEQTVSEEYLRFLREREISYTFAGADGHDYAAALASLENDFGLKRMTLIGGGLLNGAFVKQRLIDEIYLVLYPGIDGLRGVNSIIEYAGSPGEKPAAGQKLQLMSAEHVRAGVVLLHYMVHRDQQ